MIIKTPANAVHLNGRGGFFCLTRARLLSGDEMSYLISSLFSGYNTIMKLEHYPVEKLRGEIRDIAGKYLDLSRYKLFFFGSRTKGSSFVHSDIDIGIEGSEKVPAEVKLQMEEDLEKLPMLYKIDLVDFSEVSEDFKAEAEKSKEYII